MKERLAAFTSSFILPPSSFPRGHPFDYNSGIKAGGTPVRLRRAARLVV
jgi:hypothetical protein